MSAQLLKWNDIQLILAVCQHGSLSGAARYMEINHSTVFRRVAAIEKKLNVRLFDRINSSYVMTEAGQTVLDAGQRIENEVENLATKLIGEDSSLKGTLRVTAPDALLSYVIMPLIAKFIKMYPDINLEINNTNNALSLTKRETDIAIRSTNTPPDTAAGKKICNLSTAIYGSEKYLTSQKSILLDDLSWLMPSDELRQLPANKWLQLHHPKASVILYSNSLFDLHKAVKLDVGVAPLPCFLGDREVTFKRILGPVDDLNAELWVLLHPDLRNTARVRAFVDFFNDAIDSEKSKING